MSKDRKLTQGKDPSAENSVGKPEKRLGMISRVRSIGREDSQVVNKGRTASKLVHILRIQWSGAPEGEQRYSQKGRV